MNGTIRTIDNEYPCERTSKAGVSLQDGFCFIIEMDYATIKSVFTDEALVSYHELIEGESEITIDLTEHKMIIGIDDLMDGRFIVSYRKLTALEKMIELHYGGVN